LIRNEAGDLVEKVELFDQFTNKKNGKTSHAYRVSYRSMDRSLTNEEVDTIQTRVRQNLADKLLVELR
jgi:phenylalanyl-tRNA synthetase alpha chain